LDYFVKMGSAMKIAKPIQSVIDSFSKLPGIGPKTAQRLGFYLLHVPQTELDSFAEGLSELKKKTKICEICKNVSEDSPCYFCKDDQRDGSKILVVEQALDIFAIEKTGKYDGLYHVLHGSINPLDNIGPDELYIEELFDRIRNANGNPVKEIIVATNPTVEGEATAMYINKEIKDKWPEVIVSRIGMGIPTGAYLEFADETTIKESLDGRRML